MPKTCRTPSAEGKQKLLPFQGRFWSHIVVHPHMRLNTLLNLINLRLSKAQISLSRIYKSLATAYSSAYMISRLNAPRTSKRFSRRAFEKKQLMVHRCGTGTSPISLYGRLSNSTPVHGST